MNDSVTNFDTTYHNKGIELTEVIAGSLESELAAMGKVEVIHLTCKLTEGVREWPLIKIRSKEFLFKPYLLGGLYKTKQNFECHTIFYMSKPNKFKHVESIGITT